MIKKVTEILTQTLKSNNKQERNKLGKELARVINKEKDK